MTTTDTIKQAATLNEFDAAVKLMQEQLGQDDGVPSSVFFSGRDTEREWTRLPMNVRVSELEQYVAFEESLKPHFQDELTKAFGDHCGLNQDWDTRAWLVHDIGNEGANVGRGLYVYDNDTYLELVEQEFGGAPTLKLIATFHYTEVARMIGKAKEEAAKCVARTADEAKEKQARAEKEAEQKTAEQLRVTCGDLLSALRQAHDELGKHPRFKVSDLRLKVIKGAIDRAMGKTS